MRKTFIYLLDASLMTLALGLLTLPVNAFSDSLKRQTHLKETQTWQNDAESSNKALVKWIQNQELVQENQAAESIQILPVAVGFQATESSQPNFTEPTDPVDGIFLRILIIFTFISGRSVWLHWERNHKKQRAKHVADILQEVENLERIRKITPDNAQPISPLRREQIDPLKRTRIGKIKR